MNWPSLNSNIGIIHDSSLYLKLYTHTSEPLTGGGIFFSFSFTTKVKSKLNNNFNHFNFLTFSVFFSTATYDTIRQATGMRLS